MHTVAPAFLSATSWTVHEQKIAKGCTRCRRFPCQGESGEPHLDLDIDLSISKPLNLDAAEVQPQIARNLLCQSLQPHPSHISFPTL